MAPTTCLGQRTTTTPFGRNVETEGSPLRISELLSAIEGVSLVQRVSLDSYRNILSVKSAVQKALRYQIEKKGFSLVEMLSPCPTDWGLTPQASIQWIRRVMIPAFPLGVFKDKHREETA